MQFNYDFELPEKFIELKKNQLQQNQKVGSFIGNLYNNYNLGPQKNSNKINKNSTVPKKIKRKHETQEMKRMNKIKTILRQQNLNEMQLLDEMKDVQHYQKHLQKRKLQRLIFSNKDIQKLNDYNGLVDIINVQTDSKLETKQKQVIYVNANKMKSNKGTQNNQECVQVLKAGQGNKFITLEKSYDQMKAIYQNNKTIHEKDTYKFNVNWWENQQKSQKKDSQMYPRKDMESDNLDDEAIKGLKRQLKPLRRHKLIGTRYAPLSQFMPGNMFAKDGIVNGKLIDSSQSEDQAGLFEYYDNRLNEINNPPGLIELDQQKIKRKRKNKKIDEQKPDSQKKRNVEFNMKNKPQFFSDEPVVEKRLKRALLKMKNKDWQEDKIFTKGMDEDKPIQIDDIE